MLSEETAISPKWRDIVVWLNKFLENKKKYVNFENDADIFWNIVDVIKDYPLIVFTKKGLMLEKVFKKNINNNVFVFTDTLKTKSISNFYKNATCLLTKKFNNNNIGKFYYENIKKYKNLIFKKADRAFLITISFPKKDSRANSLSLINKNDL
jgi:pyruvate kinase